MIKSFKDFDFELKGQKIYEAIDNCENDEKKLKELANTWKTNLDIKRNPIPSLIKSRDDCFLSKTLSKIKTDIELDVSLSDLITSIDFFELEAIKTEFGFKTL